MPEAHINILKKTTVNGYYDLLQFLLNAIHSEIAATPWQKDFCDNEILKFTQQAYQRDTAPLNEQDQYHTSIQLLRNQITTLAQLEEGIKGKILADAVLNVANKLKNNYVQSSVHMARISQAVVALRKISLAYLLLEKLPASTFDLVIKENKEQELHKIITDIYNEFVTSHQIHIPQIYRAALWDLLLDDETVKTVTLVKNLSRLWSAEIPFKTFSRNLLWVITQVFQQSAKFIPLTLFRLYIYLTLLCLYYPLFKPLQFVFKIELKAFQKAALFLLSTSFVAATLWLSLTPMGVLLVFGGAVIGGMISLLIAPLALGARLVIRNKAINAQVITDRKVQLIQENEHYFNHMADINAEITSVLPPYIPVEDQMILTNQELKDIKTHVITTRINVCASFSRPFIDAYEIFCQKRADLTPDIPNIIPLTVELCKKRFTVFCSKETSFVDVKKAVADLISAQIEVTAIKPPRLF